MAETNELPEWNVQTHGPLPERLAGKYRPVGAAPVFPLPEAQGPVVPASPDGAHVGTRVVEGPTGAGDGGAELQPAATGIPEPAGQQAGQDSDSGPVTISGKHEESS